MSFGCSAQSCYRCCWETKSVVLWIRSDRYITWLGNDVIKKKNSSLGSCILDLFNQVIVLLLITQRETTGPNSLVLVAVNISVVRKVKLVHLSGWSPASSLVRLSKWAIRSPKKYINIRNSTTLIDNTMQHFLFSQSYCCFLFFYSFRLNLH